MFIKNSKKAKTIATLLVSATCAWGGHEGLQSVPYAAGEPTAVWGPSSGTQHEHRRIDSETPSDPAFSAKDQLSNSMHRRIFGCVFADMTCNPMTYSLNTMITRWGCAAPLGIGFILRHTTLFFAGQIGIELLSAYSIIIVVLLILLQQYVGVESSETISPACPIGTVNLLLNAENQLPNALPNHNPISLVGLMISYSLKKLKNAWLMRNPLSFIWGSAILLIGVYCALLTTIYCVTLQLAGKAIITLFDSVSDSSSQRFQSPILRDRPNEASLLRPKDLSRFNVAHHIARILYLIGTSLILIKNFPTR